MIYMAVIAILSSGNVVNRNVHWLHAIVGFVTRMAEMIKFVVKSNFVLLICKTFNK